AAALARTRSADRGPPPLAGACRRCCFLPSLLRAPLVAGEHINVRAFLLAQLPLLPRPRHVGHRDIRPSPTAPPRARFCASPARLSREAAPSRLPERSPFR